MPQEMRRFHSVEKNIGDITGKDVRVAFIGTVIDKKDGLTVDDGTGTITVESEDVESFKLQDIVRVIGKVNLTENEIKINGEIIQNFNSFNLKLYKRAKEILNT